MIHHLTSKKVKSGQIATDGLLSQGRHYVGKVQVFLLSTVHP